MIISTKTIIHLFSILTLAIFLTNCSGKKASKPKEGAPTLNIDGSSTVYPITNTIIEKYKIDNNDLNISLAVSGTGGGFDKFAEKFTAINNASRKIKPSEAEKCKTNGIEYTEYEIAYDGIAIVVNNDNDWVDYLTVDELKRIWKSDSVENWSDVRPNWPNEPIKLFGPGENSGTYDYFSEAIVGKGQKIKNEYIKSENDNLLVKGITYYKNSLGFFGLAYYEENKSDLKIVPVNNEASSSGAIYPTPQTIASGEYTPLARSLFIYVNNKFKNTTEGKNFLKFYLNNATKSVTEVGYVPLENSIYQKELGEL